MDHIINCSNEKCFKIIVKISGYPTFSHTHTTNYTQTLCIQKLIIIYIQETHHMCQYSSISIIIIICLVMRGRCTPAIVRPTRTQQHLNKMLMLLLLFIYSKILARYKKIGVALIWHCGAKNRHAEQFLGNGHSE